VNVSFVDAHLHANSRSYEDFVRLKVVGCQAVLAVAGPEGGFSGPDSVKDHFNRLAKIDRPRVIQTGLEYYLALGIHPAAIPRNGEDQLILDLADCLKEHQAIAVGEIGLEALDPRQENVLAGQLEVARDCRLPAVIHTPRQNKAEVTKRIIEIVQESGLPPEAVLLDHLNDAVLPLCLDTGYWLGLSVHPAKLTPAQVANIVRDNVDAKLVLSTDMGANPSFLFGIPASISAMQDIGLNETTINAVVKENTLSFLGVNIEH
jgi:predicted metal-dependent TIM-barrel fold hydrolase